VLQCLHETRFTFRILREWSEPSAAVQDFYSTSYLEYENGEYGKTAQHRTVQHLKLIVDSRILKSQTSDIQITIHYPRSGFLHYPNAPPHALPIPHGEVTEVVQPPSSSRCATEIARELQLELEGGVQTLGQVFVYINVHVSASRVDSLKTLEAPLGIYSYARPALVSGESIIVRSRADCRASAWIW